MQRSLSISKKNLESLYSHAEKCLPYESVALLFGNSTESEVNVKRIEPVDNEIQSSTEFMVNPETQYRLLIEADNRGEELVCIFHSHPAPPRPSERDLRYMRLNPVIWLVASKQTGSWQSKAYYLTDTKLEEVPVKLHE